MHGICLFIYFSESSVNELKLDICIVFGQIIKCEYQLQLVKMMCLICWPLL